MSDFKVIETQEQLDAVIASRLERERKAVEKKYEGFLSPEQVKEQYKNHLSAEDVAKKYTGYLSPDEVAKKDSRIKQLETDSLKVKIAVKNKLPLELANRLVGTTEEELEADAKTFASFSSGHSSPLASNEPSGKSIDSTSAYMSLVEGLKGE